MALLAAEPLQPVPASAATASTAPTAAAASSEKEPPQEPQEQPPPSVPQQQSYSSSYSSSPRQFPTELPDAILEEEAGESGSESPIEPLTPVSGRHSQEFTALYVSDDHNNAHHHNQNHNHGHHQQHHQLASDNQATTNPPPASPVKAALLSSSAPASTPPGLPVGDSDLSNLSTSTTSNFSSASAATESVDGSAPQTPKPADPQTTPRPVAATPAVDSEQATPTLSRRSTRGSTHSFKRTMSSLFRRSNSQTIKDYTAADAEADAPSTPSTNGYAGIPTSAPAQHQPPPPSGRRFSLNRSSTTTRSNTPPSPSSPLEMAPNNRFSAVIPGEDDFLNRKKNRASTGFTLRGRAVNFVGTVGRGTGRPRETRRANSFDHGKDAFAARPSVGADGDDQQTYPPERLPWALPPAAGTGAKARRMSLSLPDDFTVDVAELQDEFEYQSKILGRHGKHLGKGAASKVTLMCRRGYPGELYAVKEFRGKSNRETLEEYEKKIKSEYSIAKSLRHPNIVETTRLCLDHARWNHVMEYCSEGDLFSLVQKGFLKTEDRKKDRLCLFKQLVQGVNYLHQNGIAHRDIKLENLLITRDSKLKITDFGVSEVFTGTHPGLREAGGQCGQNMGEVRLCSPGICGSEPYIAPEVLAKRESYDPRPLDVWSSAIVMIYLTFGGAIWARAESGNPHYDKLVTGWEKWEAKHPEEGATITETDYPFCYALDVGVTPPALRRLLLQMLHPDPAKRIGMADVAGNRWVKNIECCQLESYEDPTQIIDAAKRDTSRNGPKKIFFHNHLAPKNLSTHPLGKMPHNL